MRTAWDAWPTSDLASSYPPRSVTLGDKLTRSNTRPSSPPPFSGIDRSYALTARLERMSSPPQAVLPVEIIRQIIQAALVLPKGYPDRIPRVDELPTPAASPSVNGSFPADASDRSSSYGGVTNLDNNPFFESDGPTFLEGHWNPSWDEFGGPTARKLAKERLEARARVARTARAMMRVCRTWRLLVTRYLYAEPQLTSDNLAHLAHAVLTGDRKWSDINLHPHSIPGRWITTLDLSRLDTGARYFDFTATILARATEILLDLSPSVVHLRLPPSGVSLTELRHIPCIRTVRALEGVHVRTAADEEAVIRLLRATKSLEVLELVWVETRSEGRQEALDAEEADDDDDRVKAGPPLSLPNLHTLTFKNGTSGQLMRALTLASLPRLTRLVTSPYESDLLVHGDDALRGGVRAFQVWHGDKIRSLTYVAVPDFPRRDMLPAADTLSLHPNLEHMHLAIPHRLLHDRASLAPALFSRRLSVLTVPRWPRVTQTDASTSPHHQEPQDGRPQGNQFLYELAMAGPKRVDKIVVDGFTWVPPSLGRWAADSGDCAMMRRWAAWLSHRGIELLDQDGAGIPAYERGRAEVRRPSAGGVAGPLRRGSDAYAPVALQVGRGRGKGAKGRRISLGTYGQSGGMPVRIRATGGTGFDEDGG